MHKHNEGSRNLEEMDSKDLLICVACGTQFDLPADRPPKGCRICDVPNTAEQSMWLQLNFP